MNSGTWDTIRSSSGRSGESTERAVIDALTAR